MGHFHCIGPIASSACSFKQALPAGSTVVAAIPKFGAGATEINEIACRIAKHDYFSSFNQPHVLVPAGFVL